MIYLFLLCRHYKHYFSNNTYISCMFGNCSISLVYCSAAGCVEKTFAAKIGTGWGQTWNISNNPWMRIVPSVDLKFSLWSPLHKSSRKKRPVRLIPYCEFNCMVRSWSKVWKDAYSNQFIWFCYCPSRRNIKSYPQPRTCKEADMPRRIPEKVPTAHKIAVLDGLGLRVQYVTIQFEPGICGNKHLCFLTRNCPTGLHSTAVLWLLVQGFSFNTGSISKIVPPLIIKTKEDGEIELRFSVVFD